MSRSVPTVVLVASALLAALLAYGVLARGEDTSLDQAVAQGALPTAPGADVRRPLLGRPGSLTLRQFRGKVVVLNFWASWCDPCRAEAPALERLSRRLGSRGVVLGATYDDTERDSLAFQREFGLTYPSVRDVGKELSRLYGTRALPETFVLDRRGRVVTIGRGQIDDRFLTDAVKTASR